MRNAATIRENSRSNLSCANTLHNRAAIRTAARRCSMNSLVVQPKRRSKTALASDCDSKHRLIRALTAFERLLADRTSSSKQSWFSSANSIASAKRSRQPGRVIRFIRPFQWQVGCLGCPLLAGTGSRMRAQAPPACLSKCKSFFGSGHEPLTYAILPKSRPRPAQRRRPIGD